MDNHRRHLAHTRRAGFTLIELLVVIGLILVLMALVLSGLNRATKTARRAASQQSASSLAKAVDQFKQEFGFLPPLVQDGPPLSSGLAAFRPFDLDGIGHVADGPVLERTEPYVYQSVVVWNEGLDEAFFRGRDSGGPFFGGWNDSRSWNDRRYSKYALAYYLAGVLGRSADGQNGPGMVRPNIDGSFAGVGYPIGTPREKYAPLMDTSRRGATIATNYVDPDEIAEHDPDRNGANPPDYQSVIMMYEDFQVPALIAFVDSFGNAFRYYRWESERDPVNELDLNIPPVLIDPVVYERVHNDPMNLRLAENNYIGDDAQLRGARYAIVSAGPDGLFGTEDIETIAAALSEPVPSSSEDRAELRHKVWADNVYEVGQ